MSKPARKPNTKLFREWLVQLDKLRAEQSRHNCAAATNTYKAGLIRGATELGGFVKPGYTIEFKDGSRDYYGADTCNEIKAAFRGRFQGLRP